MPRAILSDRAAPPRGHYSQAVRAGNFVFISGQLPVDIEGKIAGPTIREQTRQTLDNVRAILEAGGGKLGDLVQVTIYISDIEMWPEVNAVYQAFLAGVSVPPARAIVPVNTLHHGALIEIQAIACLENPE